MYNLIQKGYLSINKYLLNVNSIPGTRTNTGDLKSECNWTWGPYTKGVYIPEMETDINKMHPQINTILQLCGYCERGEKHNTLDWKEEDLMDKKVPQPPK